MVIRTDTSINALIIQNSSGTKYAFDNPYGNGRRSIIEVEPQNFAAYNSRPTSSHFDNGYIGEFNGNRYYLETTGWNWSTHNSYANSAGGYLFVPNTKEEWDWMMTRLQSVSNGQWHYTGIYQVNNSDYQSDQIKGGWTARDGSYVLMPGESTVMVPGGKAEYEFTHTITQVDVDDGTLINQVFVSAEGTSLVTETSDDGIDNDGNTVDDPTVIEISKQSSVTIAKTATVSDVNGDGLNGVGDIIEYTIVVTNTGNTQLTTTTILDSLTDGLGNARSLNTTVTYVSTVATVTIQVAKQNLFYYSNQIDDTHQQWNESYSGIDGSHLIMNGGILQA